MATRTSDLTEFAKPVADRLAARSGSLKHMLSAAVMAFDNLLPDERERYMAAAVGAPYQTQAEVELNKALLLIKEKLADSPPGDVTNVSPELQDLVRVVRTYITSPKPPAPKRRIGKAERQQTG